ncbi:MAG: hypothetical protein ABIH66_03890 [bacterium]
MREGMRAAGPPDFSVERLLRKVVLFGYGFFLLFLFRNDVIRHFIHERYQFLTVAGALILIAFSILYSALAGPRPRKGGKGRGAAGWVLLSAFVLAPVVWGFAAPPEVQGLSDHREHSYTASFAGLAGRRDAEVLRRRGPGDVTLELPAADGSGGLEARAYTPLNLLELNVLLYSGLEDYLGDRVALRGQVAHDDDLAPDEFFLIRAVVTCCVAHADYVTAVVSAPGSEKPAEKSWVTVYGRVGEHHDVHEHGNGHGDEHDHGQPFVIEAEKIEPIGEPTDPYMGKWNRSKPFRF